jgi:hypothetical protein
MCHKPILPILLGMLGMLAASPVLAQEGAEEPPPPCTVEPIFHCAESMDDGGAIAHFGYRMSCPESEEPIDDMIVPIGDDNYFAPGPIDRGQPMMFAPGDHTDEFESQYLAEEVKKGSGWTVRKIGINVDFTRTKDASLDCENLPY